MISAAWPAWADVGVRVGPRIGVELHDDPDLVLGADARLSFPLSPLTINPAFDYYFDEDRTLYQVSVNAQYYLPIPLRLLDTYVGAGFGVNAFSYDAGVPTSDNEGFRAGLNLLGGVCLDLPVAAPFVQATASVGDIDLVTIGGGLLFDFGVGRRNWDTCGRRRLGAERVIGSSAAPAETQFVATPYIHTHLAGDVEANRGGFGASLAYFFRVPLGVELAVELNQHFFKDADVADLVPAGVDLNTNAAIFMGNVVVPYRVRGAAGIWTPYGTAGVGVIHAWFESVVFESGGELEDYDNDQDNLAFNAGGGVMHTLTELVGLRVDVRYFRALVDENAREGGYFEDYGFWRVSVGATFGFPK